MAKRLGRGVIWFACLCVGVWEGVRMFRLHILKGHTKYSVYEAQRSSKEAQHSLHESSIEKKSMHFSHEKKDCIHIL